MKCPYCVSELNDDALVCVHCRRDLYLFKPLLAKIETLEQQAAAVPILQSRIEELEAQLHQDVLAAAPATAALAAPSWPTLLGRWLQFWLLPLALLLTAHGLIVLAYDLDTLYLRLVSLLIPLPFGFFLLRRHAVGLTTTLVSAFAMALLAVLGMSWMTAQVDHVPVLPQDAREWREFLEYAASVGFSFISGAVVGTMLRVRRQLRENRDSAALRLAQTLGKGKESAEKAHAIANKLNDMIGTITTLATTAISIYTGLKGVLGN
ncbi:hypothetical protein DLREEDagrD3_14950 [Denitratisoma sp. agr-D3]